jgi:acid phosphatase type 7
MKSFKTISSSTKRNSALLVLCLFFCGLPASIALQDPYAFYLTWKEDPTSTIVIDWHHEEETSQMLFLREKKNENWMEFASEVSTFPFSSRHVHRVFIDKLEEDSEYEIKFFEEGKVYYFRTMPADLSNKPLRIAIGGDAMHHKEVFEKMNKVVSSHNPDFVIIGGDMAYENGLAGNVQRIYDWFDAYSHTLVTADSRIIPCLVAAGNHEVVGGYYTKHEAYEQTDAFRAQIAPYFYALFPFPGQPGYNVLDFGKYLSLIILDTEHSNPIRGDQTDWLKKVLEERKDVLHKIPVYHVPAYPSVRDYAGVVQTLVRETWTPIFDDHQIKIAFENHDHAYKRTYPIRNNELNPEGIIYVGDGSWGVEPRDIHDVATTWYLEHAHKIRAFTLLTLSSDGLSFISVDEEGEVIDSDAGGFGFAQPPGGR